MKCMILINEIINLIYYISGKTIWISHKGPYGGPVAGDISVDNTEILIKTYEEILYWRHVEDVNLWDTLSRPGTPIPCNFEPRGESVAWSSDSSGYYTLSENKFQPLYYFEKKTSGTSIIKSTTAAVTILNIISILLIIGTLK